MEIVRGLILALDVTDRHTALRVAKETSNWIDAIKINYPLVLGAGPDIINELSEIKPVICDFKVADIPNTNRLITEEAMGRGAEGIIVHGFVGSDSVKACMDAAGDKDVFMVTEMSHPGGNEYTAKLGEELAQKAVEWGVTGIIAPATRPERIKQLKEKVGDLMILSPGVGAQGGTAREALDAGASAVIVGRAIYLSNTPGESAKEIYPNKT
ncbi:MAG: orotidine-5'-phosphate decarboxylase [Thermoplasmata archaeon]